MPDHLPVRYRSDEEPLMGELVIAFGLLLAAIRGWQLFSALLDS